eukprot:scaffold111754_cov19-Tisochrysis_lutea.AAC.1
MLSTEAISSVSFNSCLLIPWPLCGHFKRDVVQITGQTGFICEGRKQGKTLDMDDPECTALMNAKCAGTQSILLVPEQLPPGSKNPSNSKQHPQLHAHILQGDGSLLDRTLLSMTAPGAPFIVHAQSDAKASMPSGLSRLGPSLFQSAAAQAQEALAEVVEKAWR